jgi:hypothetical protein
MMARTRASGGGVTADTVLGGLARDLQQPWQLDER